MAAKKYIGSRSCVKCKVAQIRYIKEEQLVVEAIDRFWCQPRAAKNEESGNQNLRKYHVTHSMSNRKKITHVGNVWRL